MSTSNDVSSKDIWSKFTTDVADVNSKLAELAVKSGAFDANEETAITDIKQKLSSLQSC